MKITVYTWAEDSRENGTTSSVFATEKELHDQMVHTMNIDPDYEPDADEQAILELISVGKIQEAFSMWEDKCRDPLDTYQTGSVELDIPGIVPAPGTVTFAAPKHVAGEKVFHEMYGVGRTKYTVNFHDGVKTHKDGSPFFDIQIFSNQRAKDRFVKELISKGYKSR